MQDEHQEPIDFQLLLTPSNGKQRQEGEQLYSRLAGLAPVVVTTNHDELADYPPRLEPPPSLIPVNDPNRTLRPRNVLYRPAQFDAACLSTHGTIVHLHGSVLDRKSLVLTTAHYLDRYSGHRVRSGSRTDENSYLTFLEHLFKVKTVLFIGYGLNELEILEYVVQKARPANQEARLPPEQEPRHFLVQGFYEHEKALRRSLETYYLRETGIGLLAFSLEENGYPQLRNVIEHLAQELAVDQVHPLQQRMEMEALLS